MDFPSESMTAIFMHAFAASRMVWLPMIPPLLWLAWWARKRVGGWLLMLELVLIAVAVLRFIPPELRKQMADAADWNNRLVALPAAGTYDGLKFAAGTRVRWSREMPGHLLTVDFDKPQQVAPGILAMGAGQHHYENLWRVNMASDSVLSGWHCKAGPIGLYDDGTLRFCTLAVPETRIAGTFPAGAVVERSDPDDGSVSIGSGDKPFFLTTGNLRVAGDFALVLYPSGEIYEINGPQTIRGIHLRNDAIRAQYGGAFAAAPNWLRPPGPLTGWKGELDQDVVCDNATFHPVDEVTLPLEGDLVRGNRLVTEGNVSKFIAWQGHCRLDGR